MPSYAPSAGKAHPAVLQALEQQIDMSDMPDEGPRGVQALSDVGKSYQSSNQLSDSSSVALGDVL